MKINKNEQDFVLKYFQPGKLDTRKALQKVKARVGIADEEVSHAATVSLRMRRIRWIAVAASILVLFTIGVYTLLQPKTVTLSAESEVMAYHLPDGTKVSLMPHSSLSYQEDDCRKVEMRGCIYYQVKHDEQHPFDVMGERGHVRVLGTQFMVDERMDAPEVMVTGGKVLFTARNSEEGVFLTKGKRARLLKGAAQPELLADYDINDVAWATHRLHFNNTPLSEVLEKLTELSGVRYTASDESKRLTGDFETDSIPQVIQVIEETLGVQIRLAYIGKQPK